MTKYGSDQVAFLLIDGYSVLGVTTELNESREAVLEETHALGDAWVESEAVGLKRWNMTQSGFYDDASDGVNDALVSSFGVSRVACFGYEGNTIGQQFVGAGGAMQVNYERVVSRGAFHRANANYEGNGLVEDGRILHALGQESGDGDTESSSYDGGASSSDGGSAYLQVSALSLGGHDDVTVDLLHSSDDSTFVTKASFAAVTAAPDAERITFAGTLDRYLAVGWTFGGTGSGPTATFMAGAVRN